MKIIGEEIAFLERTGAIGSWHWDFQTDVIVWSDEFYKICGLNPDEVILNTETVVNSIHPDDRADATKAVSFAIDNEVPYNCEYRIKRPDGTIRFIIANGKATYDETGKPLYMFGTIQDITNQRDLRHSLTESNRKLQTVINNLQGFVYRCENDKNWRMDYISEGCFAISGYQSQEFIDGNVLFGELILKEDRQMVWDTVQEALSRREAYSIEFRIKGKDEKIRYLWEQGTGVFDENGVLKGLEGIITDRTKQKDTEQELWKNEMKNKSLLAAMPDLMIVYDKQGNHLEIHAPDNFQLAAPYEEHIGQNIDAILPAEVCKKIRAGFAKCVKTNEIQIVENLLEIDKKLRHMEGRIVPTHDGNFLAIIRDITDKKATDETLYLRNKALAATSSGVLIADAQQPNMPIVYANQAFAETTGYSPADFIGKNCRFLQGDDREQEEIKTMASAIKNGQECQVVLRNYRKDGSFFWNEISITPIYNQQKVLTHYVGIQNDVSARKSEEFFKNGQTLVMDMIIQLKPLKDIAEKIIETIEAAIPQCMGSILLLNQETGRLHKLAAPNLPKSYSDAIEGLAMAPNMGLCGTVAHTKEETIVSDIANDPLCENYKDVAQAAGLRACWSFPIFSSGNDLLGTFAIYFKKPRAPLETEKSLIYNIVQAASVAIEQHNTSAVLKKSKKELAAYAAELENKVDERTVELKDTIQKLVETNLSLEDQVLITKLAENKAIASQELLATISKNFPRGFVSVINPNYEVVFIEGEEMAELGFKGLADSSTRIVQMQRVPEKVKQEVKKNVKKTLEGEHCSFEINFQNKTYLVNTTPLYDEDHKIVQALLIHNNISDQKKIETEIRTTLQKEKELNELKSRFISTASHEFRTPLSTILNATNLIERQNELGQEEKRLKYIGTIKSGVKSLVAILNDFLSLSKLEEGKTKPEPVLFDLVDFANSLVREVEAIKKKGQTIELTYNQSRIDAVLDPKLMRHIMQNMLSNAVKYSNENQQILCKVDGDGTGVSFSVTDEGIGVPLEDQEFLFQRFFRAKNAMNIQGTGLGLNIVKQYSELMGGSISFRSRQNEGTTFKVELPSNLLKHEANTTH